MIAIITSSIHTYAYSYFSTEERYTQTIATINSLADAGFAEIFLLDNSVLPIDANRLKNHTKGNLKIFLASQFGFKNKGLNEALLILNHIHNLPTNLPIFKISGRYKVTSAFDIQQHLSTLKNHEIIGVGAQNLSSKDAYFNTRGYVVINSKHLEDILILAIEEMISYARGIHGFSGLNHILKSIFKSKPGSPFQLSIEHAFAKVLNYRNQYKIIDKINVEGYLAGAKQLELISE
ncbi:MAG: hypothetical protein EOO44_04140 [Flavobacterium sp.]|uniref:hypothetical protein n=1 Tax=Pedobacter agri TaxID=454586 RepID=UPI0011FC2BE4|nr:hypothetical protein [Pedobacter agri]MDQ1141882.1 hypothetical protein [Pedobacter agri]RZJ54668.1 MAG: hypothetical protein EOO44_04140 [Flavobacterium sp.]